MTTDRDGTGASLRRTLRRSRPVVVAVAVLTAALSIGLGPLGVVVAVVTVGVWAVAPIPYAIAAGHIGLIALGPASLDPVAFVVVEAGFAATLLAATVRIPVPTVRDTIGAVAVAGVGLAIAGAVTLAAATALPTWAVAGVLFASLGTVAYAIHRYQLVQFGLITELESAFDPGAYVTGESVSGEVTDR